MNDKEISGVLNPSASKGKRPYLPKGLFLIVCTILPDEQNAR